MTGRRAGADAAMMQTNKVGRQEVIETLNSVRTIDFVHVLSGAYCAQHLPWFGVNVITVERTGAGNV
ncbi:MULTISPECIES: hypothetical protein [unclassified Burkholderia]|uniref:hypothetical protein n=1 Tax=unclassified Burkholderia TaxID=2613784 RepID=UPI000F57A888|nr:MULTISPECIES: hypothetical protein [unclassified Burkholderia]RQR33652.1 hypothetical protein DIE22_18035 [Burkholderia sp. Bp9142]RQR45738.1 hypothetical protein DIE21_30820 [Burkholderia sp. Bp9140]